MLQVAYEKIQSLIEEYLESNIKKAIKEKREQKVLNRIVEGFLVDNLKKIFFSSDLEHEIDFEGVINYLNGSMIDDIDKYLCEMNRSKKAEHEKAIITILMESMTESDAAILLSELASIIKTFKMKSVDSANKYINAEAVNAVNDHTEKCFDVFKEELRNDLIKKDGEKEGFISKEKNNVSVENRYQTYKDSWKENLFLNDFTEDDENAGTNIELNQLYIEPEYIWRANKTSSSNLQDKFISINSEINRKRHMLLILGQPGGGKSSLISWFINKLEKMMKREIYVYRFSDFRGLDWNNESVAEDFVELLRFSVQEFNNKIIFLDGFDEVYVNTNREKVLNRLYNDIVQKYENFSLFVTCRENYIDNLNVVQCDYITLQAMDKEQIGQYYRKYMELTKQSVSEDSIKLLWSKKDIFGIPIVLYMTLALNVNIEKESSVVDVYDQIFAINNGIYDHAVLKSDPHRIQIFKEQLHCISKEFAVWMFNNKPEEATITENEYKQIIKNMVGEEHIQDVLIGNYFKHCEGVNAGAVCFVHRTIYEYYLASDFCDNIWKGNSAILKDKEQFAKFFVSYFQEGVITENIGEYIKCKIEKHYHGKNEEYVDFFSYLEDSLIYLIQNGFLCDVTLASCSFLNKIKSVGNLFSNYIIILQLLSGFCQKSYIMNGKWIKEINEYMKLALVFDKRIFVRYLKKFNLEGAVISDICLEGANLQFANMSNAELNGINLKHANLESVNFQDTCAIDSIFIRAYLKEANFTRANLRGINLRTADLEEIKMSRADLSFGDLQGCYIFNGNFESAHMKYTNLDKANLRGANMENAYLKGARLRNANLENANMMNSYLRLARFQNADLQNANLEGATLDAANFEEANLKGAKINIHADKIILYKAKFYYEDFDECDREYLKQKGAILEMKEILQGRHQELRDSQY